MTTRPHLTKSEAIQTLIDRGWSRTEAMECRRCNGTGEEHLTFGATYSVATSIHTCGVCGGSGDAPVGVLRERVAAGAKS